MQITDEMVMAALAAFHKSPDWFDDYDADDAAVLRHDMQAALKSALSAALEESTQLSEANCVDLARLPVGTPVTKVLGYPFPGTVVSAFHTLSGQERFVVEATGDDYRGMLHIFNGDQLRALATKPFPSRRS